MKRSRLVRRTPLRSSTRIKPRRTRRERVLFKAVTLERAGFRCEVARDGVRCEQRATQAHHVLPRGRGGTDDHANGLAVCANCHWWIHHDGQQEAVVLGYLRHSWDAPHIRLVRA